MSDPRRVAGADIHESRASECKKCKAPLLLGLVRDVNGTLKWRNFEAKPEESGGLRVYLRHLCPP